MRLTKRWPPEGALTRPRDSFCQSEIKVSRRRFFGCRFLYRYLRVVCGLWDLFTNIARVKRLLLKSDIKGNYLNKTTDISVTTIKIAAYWR